MPNMELQTVLCNQDGCRLFDVIIDPIQHLTVVTIILAQLKMNRPSIIQEGLRCILGDRSLLHIDTPQQSH